MGLNELSVQAMHSWVILTLFTFWKLWLHSDTLIVTTHFIQLPVHDLTYLLTKSISPGGNVHSTHAIHGRVELFSRGYRLLPLPHRSSGIVFLCTTDAPFIRLYSCELHMKDSSSHYWPVHNSHGRLFLCSLFILLTLLNGINA